MSKQRSLPRGAQDAADDAETFRAAVRDVTPLAAAPTAAGLTPPAPRVRRRRAPASALESIEETMPLAVADAVTGDEALSFQRAGVRIQVMRRLRRGLYPIDDELDLHGLSEAAARTELAHFLDHSREAGCRCVRIVHGKGYRSGARGPVLKSSLNLWLRRHLDVLAFVSARAIDGGAGAMYVLLRT